MLLQILIKKKNSGFFIFLPNNLLLPSGFSGITKEMIPEWVFWRTLHCRNRKMKWIQPRLTSRYRYPGSS